MNIDLADFLQILSRTSAYTAAILVIWALMTERLVPKSRLDDCITTRDRVIMERNDLATALEAHHEH